MFNPIVQWLGVRTITEVLVYSHGGWRHVGRLQEMQCLSKGTHQECKLRGTKRKRHEQLVVVGERKKAFAEVPFQFQVGELYLKGPLDFADFYTYCRKNL